MSKAATTKHDRTERGVRPLWQQPIAFLGLFLSPFAGLFTAWAMHLYIVGFQLRTWTLTGSPAALGVTNTLIGVAAVVLSYTAWCFAEHRKMPLRIALAASVFTLTALFGVSVGVGPHRWWSFAFICCAWFVAATWSLTRLNVTRADPRTDGQEAEGPEFIKRLKGWAGKAKTVYNDDGTPLRTEVRLQAAPGDTIGTVQEVIPNIESYAGAPGGMTTAIRDPDRADRGVLDVLHVDPLKNRLPYGPPSHPGGSIEDPITFASYNSGHPVWCHLAGGPVAVNPTGGIIMGTSRAGKTLGENLLYTEVGSRTDVVIMYLNKAKGMQDIRPIAPIVEVAVISDSDQDYASALDRLKGVMAYRQRVLGEYGISAWSSKRCFHNPPQRKANGDPVPMEPMPYLMLHVGEADAVLDNYKADDGAVYVASKGLSLGVASFWSLQRAGHEQMPTSLRDNLGARWCFGTLSQAATAMALSDPTMDAGAHPEHWGARKPGYFYFEGPGVEETLYPRFAKTQSLAPGMSQDALIDEHNAAMAAEMLRRNLANAPRMARLDRGSAEATGMVGGVCWWDLMARRTAELRVQLGATADRKPQTRTADSGPQVVTADRTEETAVPKGFTVTAIPPGGDPDDMEAESEIRDEIRLTREVDGVELYPEDEDGDTAEDVDPAKRLEVPPDLAGVQWSTDPRPEAATRNEAIAAVREALVALLNDPGKRDPDEDGAAIIKVEDVTSLVRVKSRSWFSGILGDIATGAIDPPMDIVMTRADEFPTGAGRPNFYRLRWSRKVTSPDLTPPDAS